MITIYLRDTQNIYSEAVEIDELDPIPSNGVLTAPPERSGAEVARWQGQDWEVLPERPTQPASASGDKVPVAVTRRQARQALFKRGLLDQVPGKINALPSPDRELAQIEWEDSLEFHRDRPLVIQIGAALGLDDAGLDDLFILAASLA